MKKRKRKYLRPDEIAWELGVSTRTIYRLIREGELLAFPVREGGAVRIPRESFDGFVKQQIEKYQIDNGILGKKRLTGDDTRILKLPYRLISFF